MTQPDLEKAQREEIRWRILKTLDAGRPYPVVEELVLNVLQEINRPVTQNELRRELDYLRDRKLIEISGEAAGDWSAELTRYGVDIVEYTIECDPGIARPPKNR